MSSQLIKLPTELVENIAYNLPLPDVKNLRLTCQSIRDQIHHPFKDRFFSRKHINLTSKSLKGLIEVARHPQLGPPLSHLFINATPVFEKQITAIGKKIHDASLDAAGLRSLLEIERDLLEKQKPTILESFSNATDRKLLSLAFLIIRHLRTITFIYDGFDSMEPEDSMYHMRRCQDEMSRPFMTTMSAIAFSGLTVDEITVSKEHRHGFVTIGKMRFMAWQYSNLRHAFANLRVLKIDLRDWMNPTRGWMPGLEKSPNVARLLSRMPSLRELDLSCHVYSSREEDVFEDVGRLVKLPYLEKCTLGLILAKEPSLMRLLKTSKKTLKHLTLRNAVLVSGKWTSFLESVAEELALESLVLDNLYQDETIVLFKKDGKPVARLEGDGLKERIIEYGRDYRVTSPLHYFQNFWDDAVRTPGAAA
ncbi:uncharacterized protein BDZ99DRAFT_466706 [Mytilinidion resinicola]|uniref:F-box domain-containing protein n=1 Tax=Mytilinidion resinicola TaxID=574789 RepID=A0A6A6Y8S9_9PEZI|nr:uncharacterized protein BDZ99DRAFT_466706 [Mytilinidion resinicola]KAF2805029.1 hypothetical protein BDZ99DRAFT_466706 [Mytilinidion resinicola]